MFLVTAKIMGLGFRLNLKWVFPLHSPFNSKTPSKLFPASSSVSGKEGYFNSPRLSFLSVVSEESESLCKDPVKACTFSSASPQILEDGLPQREDIKVPTGSSPNSNGTPNPTHFSLLVQSLGALEESFADSDASRLEREILLQLGRLGALAFFDTRFSRSLGTSSPGFLDLSSAATECVEVQEETGEKVVRTGKGEERKSRKRRSASPNKVSAEEETMWRGVRHPDASPARKSRTRRLSVAKNEADMATAVKIVVKLERIRTALEEETGAVVSLSLWAEAADLNEDALRKRLSFGWQCRDELVRSTKSLVLYLARSYRGLGIALDDLLQAGKLGVLQGAERFDQTRGYRFSTYVRYWIKKSMSRLVASHGRGILIPATVSKAMNQIQKARKTVSNDQRRYPDEDEIATLTGLSVDKIRLATTCLRPVGSVDQKINESFSGKRMEYMADVTVKSPEESVMRQQMKRDMSNIMSVLDSRERHVLILRYGLAEAPPKSLEEIGRIFHVSKEWIRKIEKKALRKLRDEEANGDLSHYLRP